VVHHSKPIQTKRSANWIFQNPSTEEEPFVELNCFLVILLFFIECSKCKGHMCFFLNVSSLHSCFCSQRNILERRLLEEGSGKRDGGCPTGILYISANGIYKAFWGLHLDLLCEETGARLWSSATVELPQYYPYNVIEMSAVKVIFKELALQVWTEGVSCAYSSIHKSSFFLDRS